MHPIECFNWGAENPSQLCQTCAASTSFACSLPRRRGGQKEDKDFWQHKGTMWSFVCFPWEICCDTSIFPHFVTQKPHSYIYFFRNVSSQLTELPSFFAATIISVSWTFGPGEQRERTDVKRYKHVGSIKTVLLLKVKVSTLFGLSCQTVSEAWVTETTSSALRNTSVSLLSQKPAAVMPAHAFKSVSLLAYSAASKNSGTRGI